jgi:hypothetical protein
MARRVGSSAASLLTLCLLLASLAADHASASSTVPQPWQAILNRGHLVGIVECETAGEIIARYRVVESWRGPTVGSLLTIRGPASVYGPNLPEALVGDRFLVSARSFRPDFPIWSGLFLSHGPAGGLPLWMRPDQADYFLYSLDVVPLSRLDDPGTAPLAPIAYEYSNLDSLRRDALAFLALPEGEREASALRAATAFYYGSEYDRIPLDSTAVVRLLQRIASASVDSIVGELVAFGPDHPATGNVLMAAGQAETLTALRKRAERSQAGRFGYVVEPLEVLLGNRSTKPGTDPRVIPEQPSSDSLNALREILQGSARKREFARAFEMLSVHDPEAVYSFLLDWKPLVEEPAYPEWGYEYGSYFAWRCQRDRQRYLRGLTKAADAYVRVAAAVYLELEKPGTAVGTLEEFSRLEGDPGAWAALERARRGDKSAVPRALEIFRTGSMPTSSERNHRNLQKRVLVLLSNSAKASSVDQPGRCCRQLFAGEPGPTPDVYEYYRRWWEKNESRMKLADPWFQDLQRAKAD